jgi:tRNA A-37 threonylcarbamoyl transferase component Bud32
MKAKKVGKISKIEISKRSPACNNEGKKRIQPLGLRTPQTLTSSSHQSSLNSSNRREKLLFSPSPASAATATTRLPLKKTPNNSKIRSVLRYGETVDSLFCLSSESSEQHRKLCNSIIEGTLADKPSTWRRALQIASEEGKSCNSDLIRLHRRATIRFSVDKLQGENQSDILAIWLSFAQAHATFGSVEEARRTYRHLETQTTILGAAFYLKLANFEMKHDKDRVEEILLRGIQKKSEPVAKLQTALNKWRRSVGRQRTDTSLSIQSSSRRITKELRSKSPRSNDGVSSSQDKPSKRLRIDEGYATESSKQIQSSEPSKPSEPSFVTLNTTGINAGILKSAGKTRKNLLPSRLSRKGLSGRATRIDPNLSVAHESESEQETETILETFEIHEGTEKLASSNAKNSSKVKMKKVDLSYMWEWDPDSRGKAQDTTKQENTTARIQKNDELSTGEPSKSSISTVNSTQSSLREPTQDTPGSSNDTAGESRREVSSKSDALLAGVNRQFLPLVHQNNILQVNGSAYAKLGVIGKGGSCKVYRALSKKCAVVAIKKVKIDGMDQKAIEGYANEISLLKRLRGNPAIIQIYDSEVDVQRKSIFVVMELGEVDLNHVLRQRALSGTCRSLNMNFIRLTWQQMLSAVHCIHEERIIHSDLKPANFLFVRGALKLIDFGIAKAIQSDDTTNIYRESHIGTLNYMSPEAILDTGSGNNGPRMKIGRVR